MLDALTPEILRAALVDIVGQIAPRGWREILFAALLGVWFWVLARGARAGLLRLDLLLATHARRGDRVPGPAIHALGSVALRLPAVAIAVACTAVAAETVLARAGRTGEGLVPLARTLVALLL